jgi:hypothetical protein
MSISRTVIEDCNVSAYFIVFLILFKSMSFHVLRAIREEFHFVSQKIFVEMKMWFDDWSKSKRVMQCFNLFDKWVVMNVRFMMLIELRTFHVIEFLDKVRVRLLFCIILSRSSVATCCVERIEALQKKWLVWPSGWVRTLFFNPTQSDGQNPKPSPRVRTPELVQGSGSDKTWYSSQPVGQNCLFSPVRRAKLIVQPTVWEPNPRFLYGPKFGLSARRTSMPVRFNSSDKSPSSSNPLEQKPQFVRPVRTKTPARSTRSGEKDMSNPAQP